MALPWGVGRHVIRITQHFSLEEMTITQVRGVDNSMPERLYPNMLKTCDFMEGVRSLLGSKPIIVSSGYRSMLVNLKVGGDKNSDHMRALACDFICPSFGSPLDIVRAIRKSGKLLDQCIFEGTWVHIGIGERMRQQFIGVPDENTA
jgi:zinc D-Ala-D-Ala carboxypeptidase